MTPPHYTISWKVPEFIKKSKAERQENEKKNVALISVEEVKPFWVDS